MYTYSKFYFRPAKGEQVNAVIAPEAEARAAICGRVVDSRGRPVEDALVLLFRPQEGEAPVLLARSATDDDGHFLFGPLEGDTLYLIKVFKNNLKLRELEVRAE